MTITQHTYGSNYFSKLVKIFLIISIVFSLGCGNKEEVDIQVKNGVLNGVFYQPQGRDLKISDNEWNRRIKTLKKAGIKTIYIQWTTYELCTFEGMSDADVVKDTCSYPLTKTIMKYAKKHKLKVVLGLFSDTNYFREIQTQNEMFLERYLSELRIRYKASAKSLLKEFGSSSAFAGWYIPEEIDDLHWNKINRQIILKKHFDSTYKMLVDLKKTDVYISSFFSANTVPDLYGKMWAFTTQDSPLTILVQDTMGITTTPVSAENKILFIKAVAEALPTNRNWGVIFEIFEQKGTTFKATSIESFLNKNQLKAMEIQPKPKYKIAFSLRYLFDNNDRLIKEYIKRNQ